MTVDNESGYKELQPNTDLQKRQEYWDVAKGLQKVDGLRTSEYLETVIQDTLKDKYDTATAAEKVTKYYSDNKDADEATREADIVAARITAYLEIDDFLLSPTMLIGIHRTLFRGVFDESWVGVTRSRDFGKAEPVLDGKSVAYGHWQFVDEALNHEFAEEKKKSYSPPFTLISLDSFVRFISAVWEIHPFREGNTRTVAVFAIKYLRRLGVDVDNTPFESYSQWFRDALVLNWAGDKSYLSMFFENIVMGPRHDLGKYDLRKDVDSAA